MTYTDQEETIYTPLNAKIANLKQNAIENISPMELEKAESDNPRPNLCIRFLRKKFICIVLLLLTIIALANIFNTFIGKLSENDVTTIYHFLKNTISSFNHTLYNSTKNE